MINMFKLRLCPQSFVLRLLFLLPSAFFLLTTNCATDEANVVLNNSETIAIISNTFQPEIIEAEPGQILFFRNFDDIPHQILSQSAPDQFDDTGTFDSLIITSGETREITIPDTTASGTTLFFYDGILEDTMVTPNGEIDVM